MIVSLNEIESTVLKACRGAGLSWGLAEEAGQAARWLAARRIAWEASLVRLLTDRDGVSAPVLVETEIRPSLAGTAVCSIQAGAAVSDLIGWRGKMIVHDLLEPLWLLPFAARHAEGATLIEMTWVGGSVRLVSGDICDGSEITVLDARQIAHLTVALLPSDPRQQPLRAQQQSNGMTVDDASWAELGRLAHRTYVPASMQSRLAGAGAGLLDND
jgi:hypothetical protein